MIEQQPRTTPTLLSSSKQPRDVRPLKEDALDEEGNPIRDKDGNQKQASPLLIRMPTPQRLASGEPELTPIHRRLLTMQAFIQEELETQRSKLALMRELAQ